MEPQNTSSFNETPTPSPSPAPTEDKSVGPAIGIVIVIIIIILGGLYFWGQRIDRQRSSPEESVLNISGPSAEEILQQGTSDDISSIENDLGTTDIDTLGDELDAMEAELQAL
jgi:hypothetical protein